MYRTKTKQRLCLPRRHAVVAGLLLALGVVSGCTSRDSIGHGITREPSMAKVDLPARGTDPYMDQVRALANPDFETRTRAARALVEAGPAALPALGRAGDLPVPVPGGMTVSATEGVVKAIVADADEQRLDEHLGSPWANVRRAAATEVGTRDRWASIPRLIERLDDRDREVRAASAASLRRLTNQWFGYHASASVGSRRSAADRWRQWWQVQPGRAPGDGAAGPTIANRR